MTKEEAIEILSEWLEQADNKTVLSNDFSEAIEILLEEIEFADSLAKLREQEKNVKLPNLIDLWWMQEDKDGKRLIETKKHFISAMNKAFSIGYSQRPQFSSNLDEAANEYIKTKSPYGKNAFKAGAEWMARQGVTKEGIAHPDIYEIWG